LAGPPLTWLYVPGDRPERFAKALASEADAIIVDLEDAVAPDHKDAARENVRVLLASASPKPVTVRINDIRSRWGAADLALLGKASNLAGIRVPKVESAEDIRSVRTGQGSRTVPLHCLIESARGVEAAFEIATADPTVARIGLGEADLMSDLGVTDEEGLLWARSRIVVAARAARLPSPGMSAYTRIDDPEGLAASCRRGRALGFVGRAAIHPRQLAVIADCFMPTEAEVKAAREVLDALATATTAEHGVVVLASGQFVDRAMIKGAERVIALSQRASPRTSS